MSQENVEVVRQFLAAFVEVDEGLAEPQRLSQFITPDFTASGPPGWPGPREFRGLDEFLRFRAEWMEPYDDWRYDTQKILDAGKNRVVGIFHQRGKPRDSESWVHMDYGIVYTLEEGLIQRGQMYASPEETLEAAGLRE